MIRQTLIYINLTLNLEDNSGREGKIIKKYADVIF